jgi:hypothetical protein
MKMSLFSMNINGWEGVKTAYIVCFFMLLSSFNI